jgi:hypothetical protein
VPRGAEDACEKIAHGGCVDEAPERGQAGLLAAAQRQVGESGRRPFAVVNRGRSQDELMKRPRLGFASLIL